MKQIVIILLTLTTFFSFSQDKEKEALLIEKKANNYVYEGNEKVNENDFISAEMEYRKAISEQPVNVAGAYNLANSYYNKGSYDEALYRQQQAAKNATTKTDKHKAFHNIGNILMKNKMCKEAVEAYKSALRNDPSDDETRYNLVLAQECAQQQQDENQNKQDEKKDEEKDKDKEKEGDNKDDKKDEGDQDKKEGDDKKDEEGKPKDEKQDQGKGDQDKKEQGKPKPQPGQLSPQQIKNLLEAMNNQEQKVQEKINAEKQKGAKVKTEKDW